MSTARLYGQFSKIEQLADGTLYVEGIASSESRDACGESIKASAMKAALPEYLKFPALREMHETWAAGRTVRAEVLSDGTTHIAAKVVDAEAIKKVRENVYSGFSIGGNVTRRNAADPSIIEGLTLTEISLVDRPANPDCVMQLVKIQETDTMPPKKSKSMPKDKATMKPAMTDPKMGTKPEMTMPPMSKDANMPMQMMAKAEAAGMLRKFIGQETMDARLAIDALGLLQSLLVMETTENHTEAPAQIADLQAAIARIKTFIASEILEADPAEVAGVPAAEASPIVEALPPAADGSGAPPPPTGTQVTAAAGTGDLAKMDSGVAAAMERAMQVHRNKMARMHKRLEGIVAEFAKMGWQEGEPEADEEEPETDEEAPEGDDEAAKEGEIADADAPAEDAPAAGAADQNPDAPPAEPDKDKAKKEEAAKAGNLRKRLTDAEAAASKAGDMLAKVMKERDDLVARIEAKGSLRAVSKSEDAASNEPTNDKPKDTLDLIKAAHARPLTLG